MSLEQLRLMKNNGISIGIHGYDHNWLGKCSLEFIKKDISQALDVFSDVVDRNSWVMCYPYGSYNNEMLDYLKTINCSLGLDTRVAIAQYPTNKYLTLPRMDTNDFPPKSNNFMNTIMEEL